MTCCRLLYPFHRFNVQLHFFGFIKLNQFFEDTAGGSSTIASLLPTKTLAIGGDTRPDQSGVPANFRSEFSSWHGAKPRTPSMVFHLHCCRNLEFHSVLRLSGFRRHGRLWNWMYLILGLDCWFSGFSSQPIALTIHF